MIDMTRDELITALEAATGPSRELDAYFWAFLQPCQGVALDGYGPPEDFSHYEYDPREDGSVDLFIIKAAGSRLRRARRASPLFTASLDAALTALLEGWAWRAQSNGLAAVCPPGYDASDYAKGATPAIALLIAILKAGEKG